MIDPIEAVFRMKTKMAVTYSTEGSTQKIAQGEMTQVSTETEIIAQPFKKIPRLRQISPIEKQALRGKLPPQTLRGCAIIYSHPLMQFIKRFGLQRTDDLTCHPPIVVGCA